MVGTGFQEMRYASIDIGTNTILMLVGEIDGGLSIERINDFYEVPRIGKGVSSAGMLEQGAVTRGIKVIERYRDIAGDYRVDRIIASATSAVRSAQNRQMFVELVREKCNIDVEVIDGPMEARLGFMGALTAEPDRTVPTLVIDIGGGSTELSYGESSDPSLVQSLDIGAVQITERFFSSVPPSAAELDAATGFIKSAAAGFPFSDIRPKRVFAAAGTATTLALIAQGKRKFDLSAVTDYEMTFDALNELFNDLRSRSPSEVRQMTEAAEGREDVLLAGALILINLLISAGAGSFIATDRGIRYGYIIHKHRQSFEK